MKDDTETTNTLDGRWQHLQPREGEVFSRKNEVEQIQHTKDIRLFTDPYMDLYHVTHEQGTLVAPRLWAEEGVGRAKLDNKDESNGPAHQIVAIYPTPGPAMSRGFGRTKRKKNWTNRP